MTLTWRPKQGCGPGVFIKPLGILDGTWETKKVEVLSCSSYLANGSACSSNTLDGGGSTAQTWRRCTGSSQVFRKAGLRKHHWLKVDNSQGEGSLPRLQHLKKETANTVHSPTCYLFFASLIYSGSMYSHWTFFLTSFGLVLVFTYECAPCETPVPTEMRGQHWTSRTRNYKRLWAILNITSVHPLLVLNPLQCITKASLNAFFIKHVFHFLIMKILLGWNGRWLTAVEGSRSP